MAKGALPTLESLVQQVVEQRWGENDSPAQISTKTVQQFHAEVHNRYFIPGRREMPKKGTIKKLVRMYLERQYDYIQEYVDHPFKPGKRMIIGAHYERKTEQ